jgi:DNA primase
MLNKKVNFKFNSFQTKNNIFPDKPKADIVALYEKLVGIPQAMKKTGRTVLVPCCFHNEKTPSLALYPDTSSYFCFACNKHGDAFNFVEEILGCNFSEALKYIKENQ